MRVLACYRAEEFGWPETSADLEELAVCGVLPGRDAPGILAWVDPIPDAFLRPPKETERGVPVCRHPQAMLRDEPLLWTVAEDWADGLRRITRAERDRMSNFEIEAFLVLRAAHSRQRAREMPPELRGLTGDGEESG